MAALAAVLSALLAGVLMLDHLHLVLRCEQPARARRTLASLLASFSRRFRLGELWERLPDPKRIVGVHKLRRVVRYVLLNPSRPCFVSGKWVKLTSDPLTWPWSTHRDLLGATADPWVNKDHLASELDMDSEGFLNRFHHYVSSDPDVSAAAKKIPQIAQPAHAPTEPLADIALAASAATRQPVEALGRRGAARRIFVALASRQGWRDHRQLAATCGITPCASRRLARSCPSQWLDAGALCLGDARLREAFRKKVQ